MVYYLKKLSHELGYKMDTDGPWQTLEWIIQLRVPEDKQPELKKLLEDIKKLPQTPFKVADIHKPGAQKTLLKLQAFLKVLTESVTPEDQWSTLPPLTATHFRQALYLPTPVTDAWFHDFLEPTGASQLFRDFNNVFALPKIKDSGNLTQEALITFTNMSSLSAEEKDDTIKIIRALPFKSPENRMLMESNRKSARLAAMVVQWITNKTKNMPQDKPAHSLSAASHMLGIKTIPDEATMLRFKDTQALSALNDATTDKDFSLWTTSYGIKNALFVLIKDWKEEEKKKATIFLNNIDWGKTDNSAFFTNSSARKRLHLALDFLSREAKTDFTFHNLIANEPRTQKDSWKWLFKKIKEANPAINKSP